MSPRIAVIGTGYLGVTHAVCMAELGYEVVGVDVDPVKISLLAHGHVTFYEPGLSTLLERHVASGRLWFSTSAAEAADFADLVFLCVGTPQRSDSLAADTDDLVRAVEALVPRLTRSTLLVGKSTVPVGTAAMLARLTADLAPSGVEVEVAWNPEFLREGRAVDDTLRPDRLVLGVSSEAAEKVLREVYAPLVDAGVLLVVTDVPTAELVKVSANAFLATKVSFINAVAELCEAAGADVTSLAEAVGRDPRIGPEFLSAGLGFGGGCLPKDLRAMMASAGELGVPQAIALLREVDAINLGRRGKLVEVAVEECDGDVLGRRIGVLGAAFKPDTDDVRDSPALEVAAQLQVRGADVVVYDPRANGNASTLYPTLGYADSLAEAIEDAHLVLHLTEWPEFVEADPAALVRLVARPHVVDGRNALDPERWRAAGWTYRGLGRHTSADRTRHGQAAQV